MLCKALMVQQVRNKQFPDLSRHLVFSPHVWSLHQTVSFVLFNSTQLLTVLSKFQHTLSFCFISFRNNFNAVNFLRGKTNSANLDERSPLLRFSQDDRWALPQLLDFRCSHEICMSKLCTHVHGAFVVAEKVRVNWEIPHKPSENMHSANFLWIV